MKWPWVSREQYDALLAHHSGQQQVWAEMLRNSDRLLDAAEVRYNALVEKFTTLRVAGAVPEPKPDPLGNASVALAFQPDELRDLIDARSRGNLRIRGMMLRQLAADRADGLDDDTIAQRITNGISPDGIPA